MGMLPFILVLSTDYIYACSLAHMHSPVKIFATLRNQYIDFEILPSSTIKAIDLRQWLVHQAVYISIMTPMPPPKTKSSAANAIPRGARGIKEAKAHEAANSGSAEDDIIIEIEANGSDADAFAAVAEIGRDLPVETVMPHLTADDESSLFPIVKTGALFEGVLVGALTCHGCEPRPYSRDQAVAAKTNQDCGCVIWPLSGDENMTFVAVFDGHGELGHKAANFCMRRIAEKVSHGMAGYEGGQLEKVESSVPGKTLVAAFEGANQMLKETHLDWGNGGGSTATALIMIGEKCIIANCGDSRIVVGTRPRSGVSLKAKDLTTDHTPLLLNEKKRIESAGGIVAQDDEESEARVWLDKEMSCGLAMSRSLGDLYFKSKGKTFNEYDTILIILTRKDVSPSLLGGSF